MVISEASIPISNPFFKSMALGKVAVKLGEAKALNGKIYYYVFILVAVLLISAYVLKCTKFGRSVYALGGNETSADLMGLNVARTKISAYAISSFCAALGGVVFSFLHAGRIWPAEYGNGTGRPVLCGNRWYVAHRRSGNCGGNHGRSDDSGNYPDHRDIPESEYLVDKGDNCGIALLLYCNSKNHSNSRRKN